MPLSRWFAAGSATGYDPGAGVRAAGQALLHEDSRLVVVEIARTRGMRGFHNQTLVVLAIGGRWCAADEC